MLKMKFDEGPGTKPRILFGLSRQNVNRMIAGEPIMVSGKDIGEPGIESLLIMFGETEQAIYDEIKSHMEIAKEKVSIDPKLGDFKL